MSAGNGTNDGPPQCEELAAVTHFFAWFGLFYIKNEETQNLARELAKLTGESMTAAVTEAVRERLDRVRGEHEVGLADRLLKIGKDCAAHLREPFRSSDHGELLYEEKGLPR